MDRYPNKPIQYAWKINIISTRVDYTINWWKTIFLDLLRACSAQRNKVTTWMLHISIIYLHCLSSTIVPAWIVSFPWSIYSPEVLDCLRCSRHSMRRSRRRRKSWEENEHSDTNHSSHYEAARRGAQTDCAPLKALRPQLNIIPIESLNRISSPRYH